MELILELKSSLSTILPLTFFDVIDIAVLAFLIYWLMFLLRKTRAWGLLKGLVVLIITYIIAKVAQMKALTFILENAMDVGLIALIILFQPEIRRTLETIGRIVPLLKDQSVQWSDDSIKTVCSACQRLSETNTGALIVIERRTGIAEHIEFGTVLNAVPGIKLFETIFLDGTPLHDAAVIMQGGIIHAAGCVLPIAENEKAMNVDKDLGTRHRAAVGMSERSDALVIVISEETGKISLAESGRLTTNLSEQRLLSILLEKKSSFAPLNVSVPSPRERTISAINAICDACINMSSNSMGALIAIERQTPLDRFLTDVTEIKAEVTREMIGTIFYKGTVLSGQAVIIKDFLIYSAATINAPLTDESVNDTYGERHRTAIALSSATDAIVIVVSSETGTISIADGAKDGFTKRSLSRDELRSYLEKKLLRTDSSSDGEKSGGFISKLSDIFDSKNRER